MISFPPPEIEDEEGQQFMIKLCEPIDHNLYLYGDVTSRYVTFNQNSTNPKIEHFRNFLHKASLFFFYFLFAEINRYDHLVPSLY
jgi:hypothetical protein